MWNSGAKGGALGDPVGFAKDMFNKTFVGSPWTGSSVSFPTYPDKPFALKDIYKLMGGGAGSLDSRFADAIGGGKDALRLARDLAFGPAGELQYSQAARRMREELLPGLSARGLTTSGPGIDIESQKLSEMAIGQQATGVQLLQQASQGLALLRSMPLQLRQAILALLLNPSTSSTSTQTGGLPGIFQSTFEAMGGGQGTAAMATVCWVAEELYGIFDIRTLLARAWVATHDCFFTRTYRKHGKAWATFLHKHEWLKPIVAPIWDAMWQLQAKQLMEATDDLL